MYTPNHSPKIEKWYDSTPKEQNVKTSTSSNWRHSNIGTGQRTNIPKRITDLVVKKKPESKFSTASSKVIDLGLKLFTCAYTFIFLEKYIVKLTCLNPSKQWRHFMSWYNHFEKVDIFYKNSKHRSMFCCRKKNKKVIEKAQESFSFYMKLCQFSKSL